MHMKMYFIIYMIKKANNFAVILKIALIILSVCYHLIALMLHGLSAVTIPLDLIMSGVGPLLSGPNMKMVCIVYSSPSMYTPTYNPITRTPHNCSVLTPWQHVLLRDW